MKFITFEIINERKKDNLITNNLKAIKVIYFVDNIIVIKFDVVVVSFSN